MYDYTQAKMNDDAIRAISSIGLAHLGDAVYELLVRTYLCVHGKATGKGLHRATVELVCAPQQARFAEKLLPEPGVPRIRPLGFFSFFRSTIIRLLERAFSP